MDKNKPHFFPELTNDDLGSTSIKTVKVGKFTFKIAYPSAPDALLDQITVRAAYEQDEYMPYWASLWPVSVLLAEEIVARAWPPLTSTIEIGCGLGLAGLAAAKKNLEVLFTDYDANALKFAKINCELNGIQDAKFRLMDIREPMFKVFDLMIVSDLIYERRNVVPLVRLIDKMLTKVGTALVSDQGRPYQENFLNLLQESGFKWTSVCKKIQNHEKKEVTGSVFSITRD